MRNRNYNPVIPQLDRRTFGMPHLTSWTGSLAYFLTGRPDVEGWLTGSVQQTEFSLFKYPDQDHEHTLTPNGRGELWNRKTYPLEFPGIVVGSEDPHPIRIHEVESISNHKLCGVLRSSNRYPSFYHKKWTRNMSWQESKIQERENLVSVPTHVGSPFILVHPVDELSSLVIRAGLGCFS